QGSAAQVGGAKGGDRQGQVGRLGGALAAGAAAVRAAASLTAGAGLETPAAGVGGQQAVGDLEDDVHRAGVLPPGQCLAHPDQPDPQPVGLLGPEPAQVGGQVQERVIGRAEPGGHLADQVPAEKVGPEGGGGPGVGGHHFPDPQGG